MEIKALDPREGEVCVALWEEAGLTRPWNDARADIATALAAPAATILAARESARIVGTVMVGFDGHRGWFYYLAVAADRRGRGVGRALIGAAETWLKGQGAPAVRLMVRGDNTRAAGFYTALGYELSDTLVFGRRLDKD